MRNPAKIALTATVLAGLTAAGQGTFAAFSATTENTGNTFTAGTVALTDNDANAAMFTMTGARPGAPKESCIQVSYDGTLPASLKLYGAPSGDAQYVSIKVERGTQTTPAFPSCTGFTPTATLYNTALLSAYPTTYDLGLTDTALAPGDKRVYRFTADIVDNNAAQGKTAGAAFTWEARS